MIDSLRTRLLLTCGLVVAVAAGTVALLASRVSASELQRFVERDMQRNRVLIDTVMTEYGQGAELNDAQATVDRLAAELGERIVVVDGAGRVVADSNGGLVGATLPCDETPPAVVVTVGARQCPAGSANGPLMFQRDEAQRQANVIFFGVGLTDTQSLVLPAVAEAPAIDFGAGDVLRVGEAPLPVNQAVAAISITRPDSSAADPVVAGYLSAVNRSVLLAALAAGLAGVALTLALSRSVLRPVEALTAAARRMARGDLAQRVDVPARGEIGGLASAFNAMADALARQEELRRHMVTDVAHELRTPLTNIRGYIEAARDGVVAPDAAMIESLHEEALLLNRLVDDLQDLALAEAGRLRLERRPTAPETLVAGALAGAAPRAAERGLRLESRVAPRLPLLDADPERIGQVLRNLLNNAMTHTPHGGAVTVAAMPVYEDGSPHAAGACAVRFTVSDTGHGIAPEHLPLIFERFFRADASRARSTGGAGLGLTIVRQLVEAHGGRVWAESEPGAGATFHFTLPTAS